MCIDLIRSDLTSLTLSGRIEKIVELCTKDRFTTRSKSGQRPLDVVCPTHSYHYNAGDFMVSPSTGIWVVVNHRTGTVKQVNPNRWPPPRVSFEPLVIMQPPTLSQTRIQAR